VVPRDHTRVPCRRAAHYFQDTLSSPATEQAEDDDFNLNNTQPGELSSSPDHSRTHLHVLIIWTICPRFLFDPLVHYHVLINYLSFPSDPLVLYHVLITPYHHPFCIPQDLVSTDAT
jgi:hypothetical protein